MAHRERLCDGTARRTSTEARATSNTARSTGLPPALARAVVWWGAVAAPLFVVIALILGTFRDGYDPLRHAVSLLAIGDHGWLQVANFVVCGVGLVASAVGLRTLLVGRGSTSGPLLIAAVGVGLVAAGLFPANPSRGFPPQGQAQPGPTLHGDLHDVLSVVTFVGLSAAMVVLARNLGDRGARGWARFSLISAAGVVAGGILVLVAFNTKSAIADVAGLLQRVWFAVGAGWLCGVALHEVRWARHGVERIDPVVVPAPRPRPPARSASVTRSAGAGRSRGGWRDVPATMPARPRR